MNSIGDTRKTKRSRIEAKAIPSLPHFLLPPIIIKIAQFVPHHLNLRLVSKEFDEALQTLHRIGDCSHCEATTDSFVNDFVGLRLSMPWMPNVCINETFKSTLTPSIIRQGLQILREHASASDVPLKTLRFDLWNKQAIFYWTTVDMVNEVVSSPYLSRLVELDLVIKIREEDAPAMAQLFLETPHLTNLTALILDCGDYNLHASNTFPLHLFSSLAMLPNLRRLTLYHGAIDDEAITALASNAYASSLTSLDIDASCFTDYHALATSKYLTNLKDLTLRGPKKLEAKNMSLLSKSPLMMSLTSLYWDEWEVSEENDRAIICLAESPNIAHLKTLGICGEGFTSAAINVLSSSPYSTNLVTLTLIGDFAVQGVKYIANSPTLNSLRFLDIEWCALDEINGDMMTVQEGLVSFILGTGLPKLRKLTIAGLKAWLQETTTLKHYISSHPKFSQIELIDE